MTLQENFACNLRKAMVRAGVTGTELAKQTSLHRVTISNILNGKICPSLETCEVLAKAVEMRADTAFLEPVKETA